MSRNFIRRSLSPGAERPKGKLDEVLDEFGQAHEGEARQAERREEAEEPAPRGLPEGCSWSRRRIN